MDGAKLAKLARDCNLLDKKLTKTDVDLIFTQVKDKTARKIGFAQFKRAVELMGKKKFPGATPDEVLRKMEDLIVSSGGPVAKGTVRIVGCPMLYVPLPIRWCFSTGC